MTRCRDLRRALERLLAGRAPTTETVRRLEELSWDAHLLSCAACRDLLVSEQALELLLASWPEPRLPAELARRVLERLRAEPGDGGESGTGGDASDGPSTSDAAELDRLLDRAPAPRVPPVLARSVLDRLASERERAASASGVAEERAREDPASAADGPGPPPPRPRVPAEAERTDAPRPDALDDVLDRADPSDTPEGLARRVLTGLEGERVGSRSSARASDEALDRLLDRLPEPVVPARLQEHVLEGLAAERDGRRASEHAGDRAHGRRRDRHSAPDAPARAPGSGLAGRAAGREGSHTSARADDDALDRVLDQLPEPGAPAGLAEGVREAVDREIARTGRGPVDRRALPALPRIAGLALAAAAAVVLLAVGRALLVGSGADPREPSGGRIATPARPDDEPSEDLLAAFDLLESWSVVTGEDLDVLLASIDEVDEVAFEEGGWEDALAPGSGGRGADGARGADGRGAATEEGG